LPTEFIILNDMNAIIVSDLHIGHRHFLCKDFECFLGNISEDHELSWICVANTKIIYMIRKSFKCIKRAMSYFCFV